jgi:hypothetical protein
VRDEVGLGAARVAHQLSKPREKIVIGDGVKRLIVCHISNIGRTFSSAQEAAWLIGCAGLFFDDARAMSGPDSAVAAFRRTVWRRVEKRSDCSIQSCQE